MAVSLCEHTVRGRMSQALPDKSNHAARTSPAQGKGPFAREIIVLLCATVLVRLPFIFTVPTVEAPDEHAHFWVISFLSHHWRLPSALEVHAGGEAAVYGSLPQLGYLPHVLVSAWLPTEDAILYARFGSLLNGLLIIWCAWRLGQEVFAQSRLLWLSLPILLLFHPQLVFVNSYANNDSTAAAVSSLCLLLSVLTLKHGLTIRRSALLGALSGALVLCKYSSFSVLPPVVAAMVAAAWLHSAPLWFALTCSAAYALTALGLSAWWFVRNHAEFAGDILGTKTMYRTWATTFGRSLDYHIGWWQVVEQRRWWRMLHFSFWGMFGYMNRSLWRPLYFVYLGYVLAGVAGWLKPLFAPKKLSLSKTSIAVWLFMVLCFLSNLSAVVWASTTNLGGPQGRYLFSSEIPIMCLILGGLSLLGPRLGRLAVLSLCIFNAAVCLTAWVQLFLLYRH